ncbi:hypothetical protein D3C73_1544220 [compost metagenome]
MSVIIGRPQARLYQIHAGHQILLQIRMVQLHAGINHSNNDVSIAVRYLPGFLYPNLL